jgi:hypothetical protein
MKNTGPQKSVHTIFFFSCDSEQNLTCNHCLRTRKGRFESPFVGCDSLFCSLECLKSAFQTYHCFESKIDLAKMLNGNPAAKVSDIESPSRRLHLACRLVSQKVFLFSLVSQNQWINLVFSFCWNWTFQATIIKWFLYISAFAILRWPF